MCGRDDSPGEIRTLVSGSRTQSSQGNSFIIDDIDNTVADFWEYSRLKKEAGRR
ncbi:MAG: hypothetical protein OEX01_01715 [Candidatus Bathyarchaeota archaeon]|nr:hypothetical protein [Candidatus Bathyarchaeota archaeon]